MLVIGSFAALQWFSGFRSIKDIDLCMTQEEFTKFYEHNKKRITKFSPQFYSNKFSSVIDGTKVEIQLYNAGDPEWILKKSQLHGKTASIFGFDFVVPDIWTLARIKRSHMEFPLKKWFQHMEDYNFFKKCELDQDPYGHDIAFVDVACKGLRRAAQERSSRKGKPNLNMTNEEFFGRSQHIAKRIYNHDDIHTATCYYSEPLYMKMKKDPSLAKCDRDLWDEFAHLDRIRAVQEEAFVIALERRLIPWYHKTGDDMAEYTTKEMKLAFHDALFRICTTLTSGWFRSFAIEHWDECANGYHDYVEKFVEALKEGRVKSYAG